MKLKSHWLVWGITLLAVVIRVVIGVHLYQTQGILSVNNGDYDLYAIGAEDLAVGNGFTNSLFLIRPPLFSVVIWLLNQQHLWVLVVNCIVGGVTAALVYAVTRLLGLDQAVGLVAALLFALDPMSISKGAVLLDPVPYSVIGITGMVVFLLMLLRSTNVGAAVRYGVCAAGCFAVAVLSRPESFLIWTGLSAWLLVIAWRFRVAIGVYGVLCAAVVGAWTLHNGIVFDHYTFSTVGGFTMAFYRAASVERLATDMPIDDAYMSIIRQVETRLGNDPDEASLDTRWGYHAASPEVMRALYAVSFETFRKHPTEYVLTLGLGGLRMFGLFPQGESAFRYLLALWNWLLMLLAFAGWIMLFRQRRWTAVWLIFLVMGYFTAGTLVVKNAALEGRERAVLNPYIMICVAFMLVTLWMQQCNKFVLPHQRKWFLSRPH